MLSAILSLGGIGLLAALALGAAARKFAVEVDPRELAILDVLSGANCGACGVPGCGAYAKAVAAGETDPSLCTPGGQESIEKIANIMGVEAVAAEPQVAVVLCQGGDSKTAAKYRYIGIEDCGAAQRIADGPKECPGGCLGLGSCARACPFGAIEMTGDGLAVISRELCTGCKKCLAACPRQVITMAPLKATVHVLCNSRDKGALVRKYCKIGCIGCRLCLKASPEAYRIEDNLAHAVYEHHEQATAGVAKCPTHCILDFAEGYPEGSRFSAPPVKTKIAV